MLCIPLLASRPAPELQYKILTDSTAEVMGGDSLARQYPIPISMCAQFTPYYFSNEDAYSIRIPSKVAINGKTYTVTSIGDKAFYNCNKLKHIKIPSTITNIGNGAFSGCIKLSKIKL